MSRLTLGSLFDGSGGFPLGGMLAGITPIWASEVEPFAIRVTTKRLPQMKHLGNICTINGAEIEPVDIITFGSPCTNLSIAGRREGIYGPQSSLFFEAIRVIKEMRCATNGKYPRYIVWENVFGAFRSNQGRDLQKVLEEIIGIVEPDAPVPMPEKGRWPYADIFMGDKWSVAYRTLDARWWGVPQRRRRIFLVGDFGGQCAGKILFESEGLSRYSPEGFRAWQRAAGSATKGAGAASVGFDCYNGALTHDVAHTLVAMNSSGGDRMPMVFEPTVVLNDQGGRRMDVSEGVTGTLRSQMDGHPPCVLDSAGFCTEHSSQSRSVGYEKKVSPTLRAGVIPAAVSVWENHGQDARYTGPLDTAPTVSSTYGSGGNNQPFVLETPKTLKIRSGCAGGGKGALLQEDMSATLSCNNDQTLFEPKCYGISSKQSYAMLSDNPHSGIYEAEVARTLDQSGGTPACDQGGMAILDVPADRDVYAMTTGSYTQVVKNDSPTLTARDYKDPPVVNDVQYAVRKLTPTECAALQGFPRWWCADLGTADPNEEEIVFWTDIFETHRKIMGTSSKPKSRKQIIKWLKDPYSESAEYRLWGNGVALPCVFFVLAGIEWAARLDSDNDGTT